MYWGITLCNTLLDYLSNKNVYLVIEKNTVKVVNNLEILKTGILKKNNNTKHNKASIKGQIVCFCNLI